MASTLNNLGVLHHDEHRYAEAREAYEESLEIRRTLAKANLATYRPSVAGTLSNLGDLHAAEHRYTEAREAYEEALRIYEELAATSPEGSTADLQWVRDLIVQLPK